MKMHGLLTKLVC